MALMASALGSVVNAKPESAGWSLIGSRYVASSPANLLALNELVQCPHLLDRISQHNVAYLCELKGAKGKMEQEMRKEYMRIALLSSCSTR